MLWYFLIDLEGFRALLKTIDLASLPELSWRGWREANAKADLTPSADAAAPAVMARWTWQKDGGKADDAPQMTFEPSASTTTRTGFLQISIRVQPNAGAPGATAVARVADQIISSLQEGSTPQLCFRVDLAGLTQGTEEGGVHWGADLYIPYTSLRS